MDAEKQELRSFDFTTGLFGGALWCKEHEIHIPNPSDACEELSGEGVCETSMWLIEAAVSFQRKQYMHNTQVQLV